MKKLCHLLVVILAFSLLFIGCETETETEVVISEEMMREYISDYYEWVSCDFCGEEVPEQYAFRRTNKDPTAYAEEIAQEAVTSEIKRSHPDFLEENKSKLDKVYEDAYEEAYAYAARIICPRCVYGAYRDVISDDSGKCNQCGNFYWIKDSYSEIGLCFDCGQYVAVECANCHHITREWPGQDGFAVCGNCMGTLMGDWSISFAIKNWFE